MLYILRHPDILQQNLIGSKNEMKSEKETGNRSFRGTHLWRSFQSKQYL